MVFNQSVRKHVVALMLPLMLIGCSETPSASVPAKPATVQPESSEEPVDSGNENGPAVSKPLEEPEVK